MSTTREDGQRGEMQAAQFLQKQGLRIVARNYRTHRGEIDIVALDGSTICFVEVRLRKSSELGSPLETVGFRKQRKLCYAAMEFVVKNSDICKSNAFRFDVIGIDKTTNALVWIKNAFELVTYSPRPNSPQHFKTLVL
ncbi:MAG TPA: YraN family protein [Pseudomonadota bacterium]|jgi:putative endonuclease|nr:YraN family protein [Pseudomonadota bacterium]